MFGIFLRFFCFLSKKVLCGGTEEPEAEEHVLLELGRPAEQDKRNEVQEVGVTTLTTQAPKKTRSTNNPDFIEISWNTSSSSSSSFGTQKNIDEHQKWYHSDFSAEEAANLLKNAEDRSWLVRKEKTKIYLVVVINKIIKEIEIRIRISRTNQRGYFIEFGEKRNNIDELMKVYQQKQLPNEDCPLGKPLRL